MSGGFQVPGGTTHQAFLGSPFQSRRVSGAPKTYFNLWKLSTADGSLIWRVKDDRGILRRIGKRVDTLFLTAGVQEGSAGHVITRAAADGSLLAAQAFPYTEQQTPANDATTAWVVDDNMAKLLDDHCNVLLARDYPWWFPYPDPGNRNYIDWAIAAHGSYLWQAHWYTPDGYNWFDGVIVYLYPWATPQAYYQFTSSVFDTSTIFKMSANGARCVVCNGAGGQWWKFHYTAGNVVLEDSGTETITGHYNDVSFDGTNIYFAHSGGVIKHGGWTAYNGPSGQTYGVASNGTNIFCCGAEASSTGPSVWCLDSNGSVVWTYSTGSYAFGIAADSDFVYVCGNIGHG